MTYLNNEKHETFLTHAIIQEGRFFITYADHGDCGSSRLLKRLVSSKKQRCFWEYGPRINFARSINSIVHRYRSKQTKDISFDLDVILYVGI